MKNTNISLTGNLQFFYLSNILQLISSDHKSGTLTLNHNNTSVTIIFTDGTIIYASGNNTESKLGYLLKRKGVITSIQLKDFLILSKERDIALGKLLVEEKIITSDVLKSVVKKQIEELLYGLFLWEGGNFVFDETEPNLKRVIVSPMDIVFLIMEATRRMDEMTILKEHIPNNSIVFELSVNAQKQNIEFVSNEWSILNLIDGKNTIQDIIDKSEIDNYSIYKMLSSLIASDYIKKI